MNDNQEAASSASDTSSRGSRSASSRRMLLRGSLIAAPTILTLKSRPVLASGRTCSPSAFMSKNPSNPLERACGDSPGCWKQKNYDKWDEYTPYRHGTSLIATFTTMAQVRQGVIIDGQPRDIPRCSFRLGSTSPSDLTLAQCINITGDVFIEAIKGGKRTSVRAIEVSNGFQLHIVAGILNGAFYGDTYVMGGDDTVISRVNNAVYKASEVPSYSSLSANDWVKSVLDPLVADLDRWNNQGTICPG